MEEVLVVERAALEALLPGEGFWTEAIEPVRRFVQEHHYFLPRDRAEYDATAKQIIPYVVVRQAGRYFLLRRKRKQTEARLHDKLSLGVGGHIDAAEETSSDPLTAGLLRELAEEVSVERVVSLRCVGVLNENNGGVSDYHAALVYLLEAEGAVTVRETEKMAGDWATTAELEAVAERLETWSQIVLRDVIQAGIV